LSALSVKFSWRSAKIRIDEGLVETPQRVARMYSEIFAGLHEPIENSIQGFQEKTMMR